MNREGDLFLWGTAVAKKNQRAEGLVADAKYEGRYVAFDPAAGKKVVASGRNAGAVVARARKLGVKVPAIVFVPKSNESLVY
jgi:hypothetical protein